MGLTIKQSTLNFLKKQEMFIFQKICCALLSCNTRFEIDPFALLPTLSEYVSEAH